MNFYQIKVGRTTRRGELNEFHSFVCRTKNSNVAEVNNHFTKKYSGFDVQILPVSEIIDEDIKGNKVRELEKKNDELNSIIYRLKNSEKSNTYKSTFEIKNIPEELQNSISDILTIEKETAAEKKNVIEEIEKHISSVNVDNCHWTKVESINDYYKKVKFEMLLKGDLIKIVQ